MVLDDYSDILDETANIPSGSSIVTVVDEGEPTPLPRAGLSLILPKSTLKRWFPSRSSSSIMVTSIQAVVPVPTGKLKSSEGALKSLPRSK